MIRWCREHMRTQGRRLALLAVGVATLAACIEPNTQRCGELLCPPDKSCAPTLEHCVLPEQLQRCTDQRDGTPCSYAGSPAGTCLSGVCIASGCGNGVKEPGEVCDDGNRVSGDNCSANCNSDETCGNAIYDPQKGEGCDCGDG